MIPGAFHCPRGMLEFYADLYRTLVRGGRDVLSNVIASQHDLHARYASVVPEIASRAHIENFLPVLREASMRC